MKCVLCGDPLDTEHPLTFLGLNPSTFRFAWMHYYCYRDALEVLQEIQSDKPEYFTRYDEYIDRIK